MKVTPGIAAELLKKFREQQSRSIIDKPRDEHCQCGSCRDDMQRALEEWDASNSESKAVIVHPTAPRCPRCCIGMDWNSQYHQCTDPECKCNKDEEREPDEGLFISSNHSAYRCPKCMELYLELFEEGKNE